MQRLATPIAVALVAIFAGLPGCPSPQQQAAVPPGGPTTTPGPVASGGPTDQPVGPEGAPPGEATSEQAGVDLTGKRVVFVLAPKDFKDEEFETPYDTLGDYGAKLTVVSLQKGECVGVGGTKVQAVAVIEDVKPKDYDAIVFIGGPGMVKHLEDPKLETAAKAFVEAGKIVAAICVSPVILARAGVLKGLRATCWRDMHSTLKEHGAEVPEESVVVSGKIITADGPEASAGFAGALASALSL